MPATSALRFDLRRAPFSALSEADLYATCIEMARWADGRGFTAVAISEHHGVDFISAPTTMAGALLGATQHSDVSVNALLATLHDPVRLAEQVATLDVLSGGRFRFVAGLGYRHEEFAMAGVDRSRRGAVLEEHVNVLRMAWSGEPFTWRGRTIVVRPVPVSRMEDVVWLGGAARRSAERAARLRLPFFTMSLNPELGNIYREECEKSGYSDGFFLYPMGPSFVLVAEDPDRTWEAIAPYALYDAVSYHEWQTGDHDNPIAVEAVTVDDLRASGMWEVLTPDECVEMAGRIGFVSLHPLMGGIPPEIGWESLQLYVDRVLPRL